MVYPLVAGFLVFLLFFFRVIQTQTVVESALIYAGRKTAVMAGDIDSEEGLWAVAQAYLIYALSESADFEKVADYVTGQEAGVTLLSSDLSSDPFTLTASYYLEFPLDFFEIKGITVTQSEQFKKWTGDSGSGETDEDPYVYVTKEGTVYHTTLSCNYLDLSIETVDYSSIDALRNEDEGKYYPCEACASDFSGVGTVYITSYGTAYHTDLNCIGLKRTISMVHLSEVGQKSACSKCGGD